MIKGTFFCIDAHTCGNPVRLITSGHPTLAGATMADKRQDFIDNHDWIRRALMFEPRGHDMMSGAFLYPPCSDNADAALLFVETSGCLPMCGHGTIGAVTAALQAGLLQPREAGVVVLDVPAGQIRVEYDWQGERVSWVKIHNVPAFVAHRGIILDVPELGSLSVDVAYGGNFYIIVEPQAHFPGIDQWSAADILRFSPQIRDLVNRTVTCQHPLHDSVRGASHVLWTGKAKLLTSTAANAVFYGDKAIDRSPCGTGTSARMAQLSARGELAVGQPFVHESIIGSQFTGCIEQRTEVAGIPAIQPSICGSAHVYGRNCIEVDDSDTYAFGFQVI
ncbi:4-hydroxyproline epimerase [Aestuariibacter halophilus]|uniref:4-hydroxyproline epimerase n=1 Tax=Fluctibacter halophilus TaxID=226011 RepID=A0ABS8G713_9ALTE|nr:4-hydroxyproline epimerase [Aestuariibacter halophilus]MCC2615016.1 4-hydroxyproline epimerase [Aestuariibacter halophilus]